NATDLHGSSRILFLSVFIRVDPWLLLPLLRAGARHGHIEMVRFVDEEEVKPLCQRHGTEGGMNADARRLLGRKTSGEREHLLSRVQELAQDFFRALGGER